MEYIPVTRAPGRRRRRTLRRQAQELLRQVDVPSACIRRWPSGAEEYCLGKMLRAVVSDLADATAPTRSGVTYRAALAPGNRAEWWSWWHGLTAAEQTYLLRAYPEEQMMNPSSPSLPVGTWIRTPHDGVWIVADPGRSYQSIGGVPVRQPHDGDSVPPESEIVAWPPAPDAWRRAEPSHIRAL